MPIQSASEFEAVVNNVLRRIDRAVSERGNVPALETAGRELKRIFQVARQPAKLKALRKELDEVTETMTEQIPDDQGMLEQLWDLADYVDYRA